MREVLGIFSNTQQSRSVAQEALDVIMLHVKQNVPEQNI